MKAAAKGGVDVAGEYMDKALDAVGPAAQKAADAMQVAADKAAEAIRRVTAKRSGDDAPKDAGDAGTKDDAQ
jgi:hypothetical protein